MAYSKKYMLDEIARRLEDMLPAFRRSGIRLLSIPEKADELPADKIREAYYWVEDVHASEFLGYQRIRRLLTEDQWSRYELWDDFAEHREVVLLREQAAKLKKRAGRKKPDFFKKSKVEKWRKKSKATR